MHTLLKIILPPRLPSPIYFPLFLIFLFTFAGWGLIQINSIEELQRIGNFPEYPNWEDYELTQDIDASDTVNWNEGKGFSPIGSFAGKFYGNGHKIKNLFINRPDEDYVGLFGRSGTTSEITNLVLENIWVVGRALVGGLIGDNDNNISLCIVKGYVQGVDDTGGIVGRNYGNISLSYFIGTIKGTNATGGLVGLNGEEVIKCYTNGAVAIANGPGGGLVGRCAPGSSVLQCYSLSEVIGSSYVGGLIGTAINVSVAECYSAGFVSGTFLVGGLIGYSSEATIERSYWDVISSGQNNSAGGIGKTTTEMKQISTYEGWDFYVHWTWLIIENQTYPYLNALGIIQFPSQPVQKEIWTLEELNKIGRDPEYPWNGHYTLMADIDASETNLWEGGKGFKPIRFFNGIFDGNNHFIRNLYINRDNESYVGLFGMMHGNINNLGLDNVTVKGKRYVGGIAGLNNGVVEKSYVVGSVLATEDYVGTLVGSNLGNVYKSYATGTVSGGEYVGGLCGDNLGTISTCYSASKVEGNTTLGGLVGNNTGTVDISYWDTETSNQSSSAGGFGKMTLEMKQQNTFQSWDFDNDWWIVENILYPQLRTFDIPTIVVLGNVIDVAECGYSYSEPGALAYDLTDGDLTNQISVTNNVNTSEIGTYTIAYSVIDSNFRSAIVIRTVEVIDTTPPVLTLKGDNPITVECHTELVDPGAESFDLCMGETQIEVTGSIDINTPGSYILTYSTSDISNNTSQLQRIVNVEDTIPPNISLIGEPLIVLEWGSQYEDPGVETTDLCDDSVEIVIQGDVDTSRIGSYQIDYLAKDDFENISQISREVLIVPIQIESVEELQMIGYDPKYPLEGVYALAQDINAESTQIWNNGAGFTPIGTYETPFIGKFYGQGYKIINLHIQRPSEDYIGLFAFADMGSTIEGIRLFNSSIRGQDYVGGIVGLIKDGNIKKCEFAGNIQGRNYVGGIAGHLISANITVSSTSGEIMGSGLYIGGLVGSANSGTISDSYSRSNVSGDSYAGGLIGRIYGTTSLVDRCYSVGKIQGFSFLGGLIGSNQEGNIIYSYWDVVSSELETSAGGEGKTTYEMKIQSTFFNWDFDNTWELIETYTYPFFKWQGAILPNVISLSKQEAEYILTNAGFTSIVWNARCSVIPQGYVIAQYPDANLTTPLDVEIWITLSSGPCVEVPSIIGLSREDAETVILTSGLSVGSVEEVCNDHTPANHVVSQEPASGELIEPGEAVDFTVSLGRCIEVPNLIGLEQTQALSLLESLGLVAENVEEQCSNEHPSGTVISQNPPSGEIVVEGTPIDLVVSSGACSPEGQTEGIIEGFLEGTIEGEGYFEGEGPLEGEVIYHSADQNGDWMINLSELLRVIQFFNSGGYHCTEEGESSEDGYIPGYDGNKNCPSHSSDYNPQDWKISLSELLRLIQFFNAGGYYLCEVGEDHYCPRLEK